MACLWCKAAEMKDRVCPNCGKFFYTDQELEVVYGSTYRQRSLYLIFVKPKAEDHFDPLFCLTI